MIYPVDLIVGAFLQGQRERGHCSAECFVHGMGALRRWQLRQNITTKKKKVGVRQAGGETIIPSLGAIHKGRPH